ncbi:MAG: TonB family protein [Anaerovibrio sp.]|uniref:energy transducer TonB n=1 Tax=Anaerovibrio sp. TaxID=1872532 RepID=UPI0025DA48AC|nr:TonB family protein [Anaerovibrio sp.]MCR5176665.1 TonB family protein [Anaerovibrio sp.]
MGAFVLKKITCPVPLSCIIHLVAFIVLAAVGGLYGLQDEPVSSDTTIELEPVIQEITLEEAIQMAKERPVPEAMDIPDINPVEGVAVGETSAQEKASSVLDAVQKVAVAVGGEEAAAALEQTIAPEIAGAPALLPVEAAAPGGDGALAAGSGNERVSAGGGASGNTAGTGDISSLGIGAAGSATTPVQGAPSGESEGNIADRFAARVDSNKKYPHMAMKRNQQGVVRVYATIASDGSLLDSGVVSSSGVASLDKAAVKAVEKSCPFAHKAGHTVNITIPIHFTLT